jgi:methanogenic corrinoid protein MtbC1
MLPHIFQQYHEAVLDTDRNQALQVVHACLAQGMLPEEVIFQVVLPSVEQMMKAVSETLDVSLAQHYMAAQIASEVVEDLIPRFRQSPEMVGRVVIGTAPGDFHGLGKRIVTGCLKAMMVEVFDLGLNVAPEHFVDAALEHHAQVIAISAMMIHTARGENGCKKVRRILQEQGLEDRLRIAVGGAPYRFNPELYRIVGADAWAENGIAAGKVITDLIREVRK